MSLSGNTLPDRRSWSAAASPSNLAMAALVGFLFVGQATDWKILGRRAKLQSSVKFGTPEVAGRAVGAGAYDPRAVRTVTARKSAPSNATKGDPTLEEIADRRPATHEPRKSQQELD